MTEREDRRIHRPWSAIISDEVTRHPGMSGRDVHKLVVQACFGGDHLLRDPEAFSENLAVEWDQILGRDRSHAILQPIHPSGTVARLHLEPCKAAGVSRHQLSSLLLSQPLKAGHRAAFEWAWATVLHCARCGEIPFSHDELAAIRPADGVTHHSETYGPASYRIINDLHHRPTREALCRLGLLPSS